MSDEHYTPDWLMNCFTTFHDPCPPGGKNGLNYDWAEFHDQIFVNPPYSNPLPWVKKAIQTKFVYPDTSIVMLLKHDSSTQWYRLLIEAKARIFMLQGRIKFKGNKQSAPFPSILVIL